MKKVILSLALILFLSLIRQPANAYMYGEEQPTSQLIVDKRIKTTAVAEWQDNLPASQIVLKEGNIVEFEIKIKNTGDTELKNIDVTDYLPSYLKFIFGPSTPNESEKEINWKIEKLEAGKEESFKIRAQIENADQINSDGAFCLINKAKAVAESGESDEDTASFCLVSAEKLPEAGFDNLITGTLIAGLIGTLGVSLRKFGRGEILA